MLNGLTFADSKIFLSSSALAEANDSAATAVSRYAKPESACVIIIDDNRGDVFIMEEVLREHSVNCAVTILPNGEEAEIFLIGWKTILQPHVPTLSCSI